MPRLIKISTRQAILWDVADHVTAVATRQERHFLFGFQFIWFVVGFISVILGVSIGIQIRFFPKQFVEPNY